MFINVIDVNNRRLCPTRKLKWVNKMISKNKAKLLNEYTLQLTYAVLEPPRDQNEFTEI